MHLNTVGLGNPVKRTCSTCHGMHMTGMDTANGWMDIGTTNLPWAKEAPDNDLPLFKLTCNNAVAPHPFLGRVIYTQDPGRALISGKCNDIGAIVMQQLRGLAARPPYFANGSAANLREVVDFYDRGGIANAYLDKDMKPLNLTASEKADVVEFLKALTGDPVQVSLPTLPVGPDGKSPDPRSAFQAPAPKAAMVDPHGALSRE